MINAKELRIGNWVLNPVNNNQHQISPVDINDMDLKYKEREGIPLTPEIILACGFEPDKINIGNRFVDGFYNDKLFILPTANGSSFYAAPYGYPMSHARTRYLHQLQNLMFALSGEEIIYTK